MNPALDTNVVHTDKYYRRETNRLLDKIRKNNERMEKTQKEIDALKKQSDRDLRRLGKKIRELQDLLA
jgi:hypothetical protein